MSEKMPENKKPLFAFVKPLSRLIQKALFTLWTHWRAYKFDHVILFSNNQSLEYSKSPRRGVIHNVKSLKMENLNEN